MFFSMITSCAVVTNLVVIFVTDISPLLFSNTTCLSEFFCERKSLFSLLNKS